MLVSEAFGPDFVNYDIGNIIYLYKNEYLTLDCGAQINNFPIAYQTYGKLNNDKSNVILICHPLTADQYVASNNPVTKKEGWWNHMVGYGKIIDLNKYFVICANVISGCMGSFGPKTKDKNNKYYGINFPIITIYDMVKVQKKLLEFFNIEKINYIIGGSMGGMQVLAWLNLYPEYVENAIIIAASYYNNSQNIAFNEIARRAIMSDINWDEGHYLENKKYPKNGLAIARMTAHVTYMSQNSLQKKFGRNLQNQKNLSYGLNLDFEIESYLRYQGYNFINRFDANSYIYLTKAMDYFDIESDNNNSLASAFINSKSRIMVIAFEDDWLFPKNEIEKLVYALNISDNDVRFLSLNSNLGHDSFLIENDNLKNIINGFLNK